MATDTEMITTKTVTELDEKTAPVDTDLFMAGDAGTATLKKFKWSNLLSAIKAKIAAWTFDTLTTTDKTLPGAVNELNSNMTNRFFTPETTTNLNTISNSGIYWFNESCSGNPANINGFCLHLNKNGNMMQFIFGTSGSGYTSLYKRRKQSSGEWMEWYVYERTEYIEQS